MKEPLLIGELIQAGTMTTVNDERILGCLVKMTPDEIRGKRLPMYQRVVIIEESAIAGIAAPEKAVRDARAKLAEILETIGSNPRLPIMWEIKEKAEAALAALTTPAKGEA